jgi:hypothetical protein
VTSPRDPTRRRARAESAIGSTGRRLWPASISSCSTAGSRPWPSAAAQMLPLAVLAAALYAAAAREMRGIGALY